MRTQHFKFLEVKTLVDNNFSVLLHGERGSGKTTLAIQIAEELGLDFYTLAMTRQTTLSHIIGFMNVNGIYVPTLFRKAVEEGGLFLLDELDAADPNVILALNTLENGYISFPDTIVQVHENFRLMATANPFDMHNEYTGRAVLDAATLDRFDKVALPRDSKLEDSLVSKNTYNIMQKLRRLIVEGNQNIHLSMRDSMRLEKRRVLGLDEGYILEVLLQGSTYLYEKFEESKPKEINPQESYTSIKALWDAVNN